MTIGIVAGAEAIAKQLKASKGFDEVYSLPPAVTLPRSATVVPTGGNVATYCDWELRYDVVLAASAGDYRSALEWLAGAIESADNALADDPTCDGVVEGVTVQSWGEFYTTTANGSNVLAVRATLTPTSLI